MVFLVRGEVTILVGGMRVTAGRLSLALTAASCAGLALAAGRGHLGALSENVSDTEEAMAAALAAGGEYKLHLTPHYAIVYSGATEIAKARGALLERGYNAFFTFLKHLGFELDGPPHKLTVIVFDEEEQFLAYRRADGLAGPADPRLVLQGYYRANTNRSVFFNQTKGRAFTQAREAFERLAATLERIPGPPETEIVVTTPDGAQKTTKQEAARQLQELADELAERFNEENQEVTLHEGAHQLAFNTGLQTRERSYPFWVTEGLACMFETPSSKTTFSAYSLNAARMNDYHRAKQEGRLLGARRLLSAEELPADRMPEAYAEAWSLFFYLLKRQPRELRAYLHELTRRQPAGDPHAGKPDELELFTRHFGADLAEFQQRWDRFMDRLMATNQ